MTPDRLLIQNLWDYGHFNNPAFPDTLNVEERDLDGLTLRHTVVQQAVRSYQQFMLGDLELYSQAVHMRPAAVDGEVGPATRAIIEIERCGCPDYTREELPAVGTGNWKECWGVKGFHGVSVHVDRSGMPSFLAPVWGQVQANVTAAYAEMGLRIFWDDPSKRPNIDVSFVGRSSGWIGLAIVGRGQSCNGRIWAKFLASYRGGSSPESIVRQWTTLVKHELGHNCGLSHSRGGVMNPSIVNNLPISWKGDPSHRQLANWFGGVAVDVGGGVITPPPPPTGPVLRPGTAGIIEFTVPPNCPAGTYRYLLTPAPQL